MSCNARVQAHDSAINKNPAAKRAYRILHIPARIILTALSVAIAAIPSLAFLGIYEWLKPIFWWKLIIILPAFMSCSFVTVVLVCFWAIAFLAIWDHIPRWAGNQTPAS